MYADQKFIILTTLLALSFLPALAQSPADVLIDAATAHANANSINSYKYNYTEDWQTVDNDMNQAFPVIHTTEYEVSFINIFPFRRRVYIDRNPLDAPSVELENNRYEVESARIKAYTTTDLNKALLENNMFNFYPVFLKGYYTCQIIGEKKIDKRLTTVVDCKIRPGITVAPDSKAFLPGAITFWIDKQQPFFNRTHMVLNNQAGPYGPGTEVQIDWALIDGVWQHTATRIDFKNEQKSIYGGVIIDTFSHFKKVTSDGIFIPGFKFSVPLPEVIPGTEPTKPGSGGRSR